MKTAMIEHRTVQLEEEVGTTAPPARIILPVLAVRTLEPHKERSSTNLASLAKRLARIKPTVPSFAPQVRQTKRSAAVSIPQPNPVIHSRPTQGFD